MVCDFSLLRLVAAAAAMACGLAAAPGFCADRSPATATRATVAETPVAAASQPHAHAVDRSGRPRVGKASFYARRFAGRPMADGTPMDPEDDNAASKTLPLGTRARVTNLETGRSAEVTIQDRGPYVPGRILDVSPATARRLGIDHEDGVAKVEVAPISVPQPDGSAKPGAGVR